MAKKHQRKTKVKTKAKPSSGNPFIVPRPNDFAGTVNPKGPHSDQAGTRRITPVVRFGESSKAGKG